MARLFRLLMMAAQGGFRYLRAIMRFVTGLTAKPSTAPGLAMKAELETPIPECTIDGVARPVAYTKLTGLAGNVRTVANAIAKAVADAIFSAHANAELTTSIMAVPSAIAQGIYRLMVEFTADIEAAPGIPDIFSKEPTIDLTADSVTAPPVNNAIDAPVDLPAAEAMAITGSPEHIEDVNIETALVDQTATMTLGPNARIGAEYNSAATLTANMITWTPAVWVDDKTLYIRQVYTTEHDGNVLILK